MPIEIYANPNKQEEIKFIYNRIHELAIGVDNGLLKSEAMFAELEQMQKVLLHRTCLLKIVDKDGSQRCTSYVYY